MQSVQYDDPLQAEQAGLRLQGLLSYRPQTVSRQSHHSLRQDITTSHGTVSLSKHFVPSFLNLLQTGKKFSKQLACDLVVAYLNFYRQQLLKTTKIIKFAKHILRGICAMPSAPYRFSCSCQVNCVSIQAVDKRGLKKQEQ